MDAKYTIFEGDLLNYIKNIDNYAIITSNIMSYRYYYWAIGNKNREHLIVANNIFFSEILDIEDWKSKYSNKLICFESYDCYNDFTDVLLSLLISEHPDLNILIHINSLDPIILEEDRFLSTLDYKFIKDDTEKLIEITSQYDKISPNNILEILKDEKIYNTVIFVPNEYVAGIMQIEFQEKKCNKHIVIVNEKYKFTEININTIFIVSTEYNFGFKLNNTKYVFDIGGAFLFINTHQKFTRYNTYDVNKLIFEQRKRFINVNGGKHFYAIEPIEEIYRTVEYKNIAGFLIRLKNKKYNCSKIFENITTEYNYMRCYELCEKNNLFNSVGVEAILSNGSDIVYELMCLDVIKDPEIERIDKCILIFSLYSINYNVLKLSSNKKEYGYSPMATLYKIWKLILLNNKIFNSPIECIFRFCEQKKLFYTKIASICSRVKPILKKANFLMKYEDYNVIADIKCLDRMYYIMCKYFDTSFHINKIDHIFFTKGEENLRIHNSVCCNIEDKHMLGKCVVLLYSNKEVYFFHTLRPSFERTHRQNHTTLNTTLNSNKWNSSPILD